MVAAAIPELVQRLRRVAVSAAILVGVGGVTVLAGWFLGYPEVATLGLSYGSMKANTALCFLLLGVGALLGAPWQASPRRRRIVAALAVAAGSVAGASLVEYATNVDLGIDEFLVGDPGSALTTNPGRMSPVTATCFVLLATALAGRDVRTQRGTFPAQHLGLAAGLLAVMALVGHLFGVEAFYGASKFTTGIVPHTGVLMLALAVSLLAARPDRGLLAIWVDDGAAGVVVRRLLPFVVLAPIAVAWLVDIGFERGGFDAAFALSGLAMLLVVGGIILVASNGRRIFALDLARSGAERALRAANDDLEEKVQRRTAEARANEARFKAVSESASLGIVTSDQSSRITYVNPAAEGMFGRNAAELIGQPLTSLMPERFRDAHRAGFKRFLETRQPKVIGRTVELAGLRADGREFPLELSLQTWRLGDQTYFTGILEDITERKAATLERDLFFTQSLELLMVAGMDGIIRAINPAWERVIGWSVDEMVGRSFMDFVHPDDVEKTVAESAKLASGATTIHFENRYKTRDGGSRTLHWTSSPNMEAKVLLAVARDVTQEKERSLATARLASIVQASTEAIVAVDLAALITSWNPAAEQLFGHPAKDMVGQDVSLLVPAELRAQASQLLQDVQQGRQPRRLETERRHADGHLIPVELTLSPVRSEDGRVVGVSKIFRDLSEVKAARAQAALLESTRREAEFKTRFINTASHELATPLTPLRLQTAVLRRVVGDNPKAAAAVEAIDRNVQRLALLVADLVDAARVQAGALHLDLADFELRNVLQDVTRRMEPQAASSGVELTLAQGTPILVRADPNRIAQLTSALVSNAIKFTPSGGHVAVKVTRTTTTFRVEVADTGQGMAPDQAARLFEPFGQQHDTMQMTKAGVGLGLYLSRAIAEAHQGRIGAHSAGPGAGSTFWFELPVKAAAPVAT